MLWYVPGQSIHRGVRHPTANAASFKLSASSSMRTHVLAAPGLTKSEFFPYVNQRWLREWPPAVEFSYGPWTDILQPASYGYVPTAWFIANVRAAGTFLPLYIPSRLLSAGHLYSVTDPPV